MTIDFEQWIFSPAPEDSDDFPAPGPWGCEPETNEQDDEAAREADEEAQAQAEYEAERAAERFYEEGTDAQQAQYRWEVEQDERNAALWSGAF